MDPYQLYFDANKALWNAKTPIHVDAELYGLQAFKAGELSLRSIELEEVGEVRGKSLLHLQCHFGMDTLSWARLGAKVTGVDLSDAAIRQAQQLAEEVDLPAHFVCSNIYELPSHLKGQFDIVFTSYGTIGWLPDLDKWAEIVYHYLAPGGIFYIAEFHPFIWMYDDSIRDIVYSYFNVEVIHEVNEGTYADRNAPIALDEYGWNHPMSEVINSLLNRGLQLEFLHEFPYSPWKSFKGMVDIGDHQYVFKHLGGKIPYVYSIRARKPAL